MLAPLRNLLVLGFALGAVACSKRTPELQPVKASAPVATVNITKTEGSPDGKLDPNDLKHGSRKLIGLDTPVYVDGVQVGVLRAGELPPISVGGNEETGARYKLEEYLTAIGVDTTAIKSVHLHGNGDRIASIEGDELRKDKDFFQFSFLSGETGTPFQRWSPSALKNQYVVNEIRRVTVYVKKPSPAIHATRKCHVGADGECSDQIPYANGQVAKGTRIYVDGKMVGFVKRRNVTDEMIVKPSAEPSETQYAFLKLAASMGVDPATIKQVDLMAGDDLIGRATGEQINALASSTTFTLPKHNHGKVRVHVAAEMQARNAQVETAKDALVSAVHFYRTTTPKSRDLVAISEDTDLSVTLAAIDDGRGRLGRGEQ